MLQEEAQILEGLRRDAGQSAAAFDGAEMSLLQGAQADLESPAYAAVKSRLVRIRGADARVRFVYLFRSLPETGTVIFLADSEPEVADAISLPGDVYVEAATSPGLQSILKNGAPSTEGPIEDRLGTWVTAYALVARDAAGNVREVLGVNLAAGDWWQRIWLNGLESTISFWLVLGLPWAGFLILRRASEQRAAIRNLSEAFEQSHTAVMIIDLGGYIEYANQGFCRQVGYSRRELIGRLCHNFLLKTAPVEIAGEMTAVTRGRQDWVGKWECLRRDGSTYPVRATITVVRNRQNQPSCLVAIYVDQSEERNNEMVLRDAKEQAEAGNRAKSHFLATMSHEVRTPLNGIVGFTNLLLETPLSSEQREYMRTIRSSGEALIQLTNDILDFARIESGKLKLELQPCDPSECIEDALDLMAARASEKNLELLHWVNDGVPRYVQTDSGRLRQVLINLVNNAVKFTEQGDVSVTLSATQYREPTAELPAGWELTFAVADTGIGIDADKYGALFRPFSQLEDSMTRRHGGAGLGLAISRNLVGLMDGQIDLQSKPGAGSTFTFSIKADEVALDLEIPQAPTHEITGLRLAVIGAEGKLREEIVRLAKRWGAKVTKTTCSALPDLGWDVGLIDLSDQDASSLAKPSTVPPDLPREKLVALVPLALSAEVRTALRPHFRLLVNKPAHHEALRVALATSTAARPTRIPFSSPNSFDLRVLLVEDNAVNQLLMQKVLSLLGCRWAVAENGRVAVDELSRADYDVVLMDLHMPVMNGLTAIDAIRAGESGERMRQVWIAALTADAQTEQKERVMKAGANDYLVKPVRVGDLDRMLHRFLATRDGADPV